MISNPGLIDLVLVPLTASFAMGMLIVVTRRWHGGHTLDSDVAGIQKVHVKPVPRVGGIALLTGIMVVFVAGSFDYPYPLQHSGNDGVFKLLSAAMPAFLSGLIEDLTKKVSVKARLAATFASALFGCLLLGAYLPRIDVLGLDSLFQWWPCAVAISAFAVAGVTNSINIIDGFHGVASCAVIIILTGFGFLASQSGDAFVMHLALVGAGATLGFLLINYPTGRLFMGDGGAYLMGFWLAEVAVLLIVRNPSVNAWQVLAVCAYPVIEVIYSIYRRKFIRKVSPGTPDRLHLHSLIYRRAVCQLIPRNEDFLWARNAAVALVVATWIASMTLAAIWIGETIGGAALVVAVQILLYMAIYTRLVRGHWCWNPVVVLGLLPEAKPKAP
jgi:UDP-N-acetylmuramyl pentapeptide phosphotransferase/UDP-N-acetylglucosamine-1-phosphate transferase